MRTFPLLAELITIPFYFFTIVNLNFFKLLRFFDSLKEAHKHMVDIVNHILG